MPEETLTAGGLPIVPAEPVPEARHTFLFCGDWVRSGGFVGKRGEFAVLQSKSGLTIMVDRKAVEVAAMALGIELPRIPASARPVKLQTRCGWCGHLMNHGPLDEQGRESTGICDVCRAGVRDGSRR
jgi:hypothetical protein